MDLKSKFCDRMASDLSGIPLVHQLYSQMNAEISENVIVDTTFTAKVKPAGRETANHNILPSETKRQFYGLSTLPARNFVPMLSEYDLNSEYRSNCNCLGDDFMFKFAWGVVSCGTL